VCYDFSYGHAVGGDPVYFYLGAVKGAHVTRHAFPHAHPH
jgi:hypothetical protein